MSIERFFYKNKFENSIITLDESQSHHLIKVMRFKEGDAVEIINGYGELAYGVLQKIEKKCALILINKIEIQPKPKTLILAQGLPKFQKLDFVIEKGTELGVTHFYFFEAEKSEKIGLSENQKERLENISIAAMKQCKSTYKPVIQLMPKLLQWPQIPQKAFFGSLESNSLPFKNFWDSPAPEEGIIFFIGPEKGFTQQEEQILKDKGAHPITLSHQVLRTETACLTAIALAQHWQNFT